jgi:hypothetical protein
MTSRANLPMSLALMLMLCAHTVSAALMWCCVSDAHTMEQAHSDSVHDHSAHVVRRDAANPGASEYPASLHDQHVNDSPATLALSDLLTCDHACASACSNPSALVQTLKPLVQSSTVGSVLITHSRIPPAPLTLPFRPPIAA